MSSSHGSALPLLELPNNCVSCVFSHLNLQDALHLSWACKTLHALSEAATYRRVACAKCKMPVFSPAEALCSKRDMESSQLELQDGECYVVQPAQLLPGTLLSLAHSTDDAFLHLSLVRKLGRQVAGDDDEVTVQSISCSGCGLYLGLRLVQFGEHKLGECDGVALLLHATMLGRCWLPKKYLTLVKLDGSEDLDGVVPGAPSSSRRGRRAYRCAAIRSKLFKPGQCGQVLFEERAILSKQHCWDVGGGVETAFYINHFREGAVQERFERELELCQGTMTVCDVHCTRCGDRIGWKFCADLTGHENDNQVGRYGIVKSSFKPK